MIKSSSKAQFKGKKQAGDDSGDWSDDINIVGNGKSLQVQTSVVQMIVHSAMDIELPKILYEHSFPSFGNKDEFCREIILGGAQMHSEHFAKAAEIAKRLSVDPKYGRILGNIVHLPYFCVACLSESLWHQLIHRSLRGFHVLAVKSRRPQRAKLPASCSASTSNA